MTSTLTGAMIRVNAAFANSPLKGVVGRSAEAGAHEHGETIRQLELERPRPPKFVAGTSRTIEVPFGAPTTLSAATPMVARHLTAWQPASGVVSMREAAREGARIASMDGPNAVEARRATANMTLALVRRQVTHLAELFATVERGAPGVGHEVASRRELLRAFEQDLPHDLMDYLPGDPRWRPYASESGGLAVRRMELLKSWSSVNQGLDLGGLVRALRRTAPAVLKSPPVQRQLETMVVNALAHMAFDAALEPRPELWSLQSFFSLSLQGWHGIGVFRDEASGDCNADLRGPLGLELFREIINNARDATHRRRLREVPEREPGDCSPLVRIDVLDAIARVSIVDAGDPRDYRDKIVVGESSQADAGREGFGIGRLRIRLLAEYLGYGIAHRPLPDGSGSVVEVEIPISR